MNNTSRLIACLALVTILPAAGAATVTARVSGVASDEGVVRIAIFGKDEQQLFPKQIDKVKHLAVIPARMGTTTLRLENIPPGLYAAFVFHDSNANNIMDHNWLGLPKETFGFIQNYRVRFLPPDFNDVVFTVHQEDVEFSVQLQEY